MEAISFTIRHGSVKYMSMQRPLHIECTKQTVMDRKKEKKQLTGTWVEIKKGDERNRWKEPRM